MIVKYNTEEKTGTYREKKQSSRPTIAITAIGCKMGFKILQKMHNAASGGRHHRDDCDYSSSSSDEEEDEESYDSFEDENYVEKDDDQHKHAEDDNDDEDDEGSHYSSSSETEIDPELLCPTCGAQTHEYVRKGTFVKKWKRLPVEDDDVVDATTGDCISCKKERLAKMKAEWLDDIPMLPEGLFKKRADRQNVDGEDGDDGEENEEEDGQVAGNTPIRTQGERYRNALRKRNTKRASFATTSINNTDNNDNNEEQFSLYDESTFSCGISIASDGRSIRTGRSKLDTLTEVPEREETSVEESENSHDGSEDTEEDEDDDDGSEDTDDKEEELDDQLEKEVSAYRAGGTKNVTAVETDDRTNASLNPEIRRLYEDGIITEAEYDQMNRADRQFRRGRDGNKVESAAKCDESVAGQNGANGDDNDDIDPSVADVSKVLEQYISAKDQVTTKQRMAEMGRTFRGMVAGGIGHKKKKSKDNGGEDNPNDTGAKDASDVFGLTTTPPDTQADTSTPDWAAGLVDQPQANVGNTNAVQDSQDHTVDGIPMTNGEKDPQLFYNEAVAAVAAANTPQDNHNAEHEAHKTKKMTFKSPFHRKLKLAGGEGKKNDVAFPHSKPIEGENFCFPDLLPEEGEKEKKSKKFGIKIGKSKKKDNDPVALPAEENPFLPSNIAPLHHTAPPTPQVFHKTIPSMFPDDVLGGIPEDRPDDSPPPPVLEIATRPDDHDEDLANPNTTDVDHLIRGLQRTVDDPRLARKFLISLRTMSIHHPNRLGIAEAGGIHAIVVCMKRFKRESSIAKQGCAALQNLVCADKNEHRSVREGALDAIVRAMMNHSRSPGTQEHGAAALRNLTAGSIANRTAVAEAGGIEALIRAMKIHHRNVAVQDKCCAALANICNKHRTNRVAIGEAGGIPYVAQALRRYGYRYKSVAEKGIRCLLNLSHTPRNVEMMKWEEGIEGLVLGVAHRHGGKCKDWALKIFLKM